MTDGSTRKTLHPAPARPDLDDLLRRAREVYEAMTPEQRTAHDAAQRDSWVRGNLGIDRDEGARRTVSDAKSTDDAPPHADLEAALLRADRLILWMQRYVGGMSTGGYGEAFAELNEHGMFMSRLDPVRRDPTRGPGR